ncbi:hypothetical protein AM501_11595 [Aneurinibacillus migulanus]|uniref:hypothetical protein n=1 Tax=Aneurinibacillus migulanus TaxID=47500 RepID=UPI0005BA3657|nr:hypothetical protein [Aneurinibacillus migulanus]KIV54604.1 hypothetical protein TS64_16455 [Aneurinibacillus migulanus]KPD07998.1 hypothetical protein AM501_11595 [Aneurinibacillus migulanus]MCP1358526.1 hypothetical protein [Aneurinibacillus migulanus]
MVLKILKHFLIQQMGSLMVNKKQQADFPECTGNRLFLCKKLLNVGKEMVKPEIKADLEVVIYVTVKMMAILA